MALNYEIYFVIIFFKNSYETKKEILSLLMSTIINIDTDCCQPALNIGLYQWMLRPANEKQDNLILRPGRM